MHKLHALLIGIDEYRHPISSLRGCVNDVNAMDHFLQKQCNQELFEYKAYKLENENATRDNIISAFDLFKGAEDGDVCLFYFSGHGSKIKAPEFWESPDGFNQSILCADSQVNYPDYDIIDKELSWLIYKFSESKNIHFVSIMDCCHSGSNTRTMGNMVGVRQFDKNFSSRPIESYLGFQDYTRNDQGKYSAPKMAHIAISACKPWQLARETSVNGLVRGLLTWNLIEAVESSNLPITYSNLGDLIVQKINGYVFDQIPQVESIHRADINRTFLGGALSYAKRNTIIWRPTVSSWDLNLGAIDGIKKSTQLHLCSDDSHIRIRDIFPFNTLVEVSNNSIEKGKQHNVLVRGLGDLDDVAIYERDFSEPEIEKIVNTLEKIGTSYINLSDDYSQSRYWIRKESNLLKLVYAESDKVIFYPLGSMEQEDNLFEFCYRINGYFRWKHLLQIVNPFPGIGNHEFEVDLWQSVGDDWREFNSYKKALNWNKFTPFRWQMDEVGREKIPGYAVCIRNTGIRTLYTTAFHLSGRYGITNQYLPGEKLESGEEVWLTWTDKKGLTRRGVGLDIERHHWTSGLLEIIDYVKIFISDRPILNTHRFNQEAFSLIENAAFRASTRSAFFEEDDAKEICYSDWDTMLIPLHIVKSYP